MQSTVDSFIGEAGSPVNAGALLDTLRIMAHLYTRKQKLLFNSSITSSGPTILYYQTILFVSHINIAFLESRTPKDYLVQHIFILGKLGPTLT